MLDALDMQVRLSALEKAMALPTINGFKEVGPVLAVATQFYEFLIGIPSPVVCNSPVAILNTIDPLPLAGEPPIETGAAAAATEAVRRTRRTKAEMEAARNAEIGVVDIGGVKFDKAAAATDVTVAVAEATAAGPAPAAAPTTIVEVKAAFMRVVETEGLGPKAGSALIKQFGVERISSLPEKDFAAAVAACDAAVAGAGK